MRIRWNCCFSSSWRTQPPYHLERPQASALLSGPSFDPRSLNWGRFFSQPRAKAGGPPNGDRYLRSSALSYAESLLARFFLGGCLPIFFGSWSARCPKISKSSATRNILALLAVLFIELALVRTSSARSNQYFGSLIL